MYVQSTDNLARPQRTDRRRTGLSPLFRADVHTTEHNSQRGSARDDEPGGLLDPALDLNATRIEAEMLADPARRERASPIKGKVSS